MNIKENLLTPTKTVVYEECVYTDVKQAIYTKHREEENYVEEHRHFYLIEKLESKEHKKTKKWALERIKKANDLVKNFERGELFSVINSPFIESDEWKPSNKPIDFVIETKEGPFYYDYRTSCYFPLKDKKVPEEVFPISFLPKKITSILKSQINNDSIKPVEFVIEIDFKMDNDEKGSWKMFINRDDHFYIINSLLYSGTNEFLNFIRNTPSFRMEIAKEVLKKQKLYLLTNGIFLNEVLDNLICPVFYGVHRKGFFI